MTEMIQTNGMHGWSYLSPNDLMIWARKAMDISDSDCDENTIRISAKILSQKPETKEIMKLLYEELVDAIESDNLTESMEICSDCGAIPETGACNYCKLD